MESKIQIHDPFKKTWSEPQIIISREDEIEYEKSLAKDQSQSRHSDNLSESETQTLVENRLEELRNALRQSEFIKMQMCTPKKCDNILNRTNLPPSNSNTPSQGSDWMIPEWSKSRSLPSSPMLGSVSPVHSPTRISSIQQTCFNFPHTLRQIQENERDEIDSGYRLPQISTTFSKGVNGLSLDQYNDTRDRCLLSGSRQRTSPRPYSEHQSDDQPIRAKRKLDMDEPYEISTKRTKSEVAREAGLRYVNQLELDLVSLKQRLRYDTPELVQKPLNCACAEMEKHFMEMAMSAYKSIRRYDGSVNGFERFKEELTQTNKVIKDSMELLHNVRRLCVH